MSETSGITPETLRYHGDPGARDDGKVVPLCAGNEPHEPFREYHLYGICLRSQIPLSFPEQPMGCRTDVTLFLASTEWFAKAAGTLRLEPELNAWFQHFRCPDGSDYLRWPDLFEFLVSSNGRSVACRMLERASGESFQTYLLGQVLSFALVKQGFEPLHSTAVVVRGKAVSFLGDCGHGKSTLAAAFLQAGHQILTDDLLQIRSIRGILCGFPGPSRIKLFPEVARRFLPLNPDATSMNSGCKKLIIPLEPHQVCTTPIPLQAFFVLSTAEPPSSDVHLTRLDGAVPFIELIGSTFNVRLVNPGRLRRQFRQVQRLVSRIPIKRLTYPRNVDLLPKVCEAILADLDFASTGQL